MLILCSGHGFGVLQHRRQPNAGSLKNFSRDTRKQTHLGVTRLSHPEALEFPDISSSKIQPQIYFLLSFFGGCTGVTQSADSITAQEVFCERKGRTC
jgi:hypothetical protein